MNFKNVSSQEVFNRVQRNLKADLEPYEGDMLEWIGDVIDFVEYYPALENVLNPITLEVNNFRALLPKDLVCLGEVWHNDVKLPYGAPREEAILTHGAIFENAMLAGSFMPLLSVNVVSEVSIEYYLLKPGYVVTSFESGEIQIKYIRYPFDLDGYPLIPDDIYFKEACQWYIMRQLKMSGFEFSNKEFTYDYLDYKFKHYCKAASNHLRFPSYDKRIRFKDVWLQLVTEIDLKV